MKPVIAVLLISSSLACAQQPAAPKQPAAAPKKPASSASKGVAPADAGQPATIPDVNRLMIAMHIEKQMVDMQHAMLAQYKPMIERMTADQVRMMTPQQRERFQALMAQSLSDSLAAYPPSEMIHDIAPIYAKYLTKGDVDAMARFYSSPAGQKFLDIQPKLVADFMSVLMPKIQGRIQASVQKMQEQVRQMMKDEPPQPSQPRDFKPAAPVPELTPLPSPSPAPSPAPSPK